MVRSDGLLITTVSIAHGCMAATTAAGRTKKHFSSQHFHNPGQAENTCKMSILVNIQSTKIIIIVSPNAYMKIKMITKLNTCMTAILILLWLE